MNHIDFSLQKIESIFNSTSTILQGMSLGETTTRTSLSHRVAPSYALTGAFLYPTLMFLFRDYPGMEIGSKGVLKVAEVDATQHIKNCLSSIRDIFEEADKIIQNVNVGEQIFTTNIAKTLGEKFEIKSSVLYMTLQFLFNDYPGIVIKTGRSGGLKKIY